MSTVIFASARPNNYYLHYSNYSRQVVSNVQMQGVNHKINSALCILLVVDTLILKLKISCPLPVAVISNVILFKVY